MANCAKCNAELIGSAKFCATCGSAVAQPTHPAEQNGPNTISGLSAAGPAPSLGGLSASDPVNPFAATASPSSNIIPVAASVPNASSSSPIAVAAAVVEEKEPTRPSRPPPADGSHVSPLAVSNALSQRGAFQQAIESAKDKAAAAAAPSGKKKPGTQLMPSAPQRPLPQPGEASPAPPAAENASAPAKKPPPRTVAMGFAPGMLPGVPPAAPTPSAGGSAPQSGAASVNVLGPTQPPSVVQPSAVVSHVAPGPAQPPSGIAPSAGHASPHVPVPHAAAGPYSPAYPLQPQPQPPHAPYPQAAQAPGGWGWGPQAPVAPPAAPYPYAFGYTPGARVHVTWSNGQRYPATVNQVSGTQCLVVFPDGQQHWVEMQYLTPG